MTQLAFDPTQFGVEILRDRDAKAFVTGHHYSGSYPAARLAVGLMRRSGVGASRLVGACVFGVPMNERSVPRYIGVEPNNGVELSRLVLLDEVLADKVLRGVVSVHIAAGNDLDWNLLAHDFPL